MPTCPTMQVRILATGQGPVTINVEDFREELHERWVHLRTAAAPEPEAERAPEPKPAKRKG